MCGLNGTDGEDGLDEFNGADGENGLDGIGVMGRWDEESQMWGWYIWLWLGYDGALAAWQLVRVGWLLMLLGWMGLMG